MRIHRLRNQAPAHGQCTMFAGYEDPQVKKPGTSTRPMCHVCWLWGSTGSETRHQHTANVPCLLAMRILRFRNQAPAHGQCVMFAGYDDPQVKKPGTSTRPMYHVCWLWESSGSETRHQHTANVPCLLAMRIHRFRNQALAHGQCTMFAGYEDPQVKKPGTSTRQMYHVCQLWESTGSETRHQHTANVPCLLAMRIHRFRNQALAHGQCTMFAGYDDPQVKKPGTSTRPMCHVCGLWGSTGSETRHQHTANVSCLPAMRIHRLRNKAPAHSQCIMFAGYENPQVKKQGTSTRPMCHVCRLWGSTG